jgi:hypothetical protein
MNTDMPQIAAPLPPAAWIGWDWADKHHDLFLESADGRTEQLRLPNEPAKMHAWLQSLGARFGQRQIAVCWEASRLAMLPILLEYPFLKLYQINPKALARFREAVRPSGSKDDELDCQLACQFVKSHAPLLHALVLEDGPTLQLEQLVRSRRDLVNQRSAVANQLTSHLKFYYPLAWELLGHDTTTEMAADFVLKFPTLEALQAARLDRVRKFFLDNRCKATEGLEARLQSIAPAVPVSRQAHWNQPASFMACALAQQIKGLCASIDELEERIRIVAEPHPNYALAKSLPGAGPALEPRLMAALGTHPEACVSAADRAVRSGVAPVRRQSGNTSLVAKRWAKPEFLHQTWIEYAKCSVNHCDWARAFVEAKTNAGKSYFTAIRALAYKWIRIVHVCWENGTVYDEAKYLQALKAHHSPYLPATTGPA